MKTQKSIFLELHHFFLLFKKDDTDDLTFLVAVGAPAIPVTTPVTTSAATQLDKKALVAKSTPGIISGFD